MSLKKETKTNENTVNICLQGFLSQKKISTELEDDWYGKCKIQTYITEFSTRKQYM